MNFFKNLLNKKNDELNAEEIKELNQTISNGKNEPFDDKINFGEIIGNLKLIDDINRIRNLLDEKERELSDNNDLYRPKNTASEIKEILNTNSDTNIVKSFSDINIEEDFSENEVDTETYEVNDYKEELNKINKDEDIDNGNINKEEFENNQLNIDKNTEENTDEKIKFIPDENKGPNINNKNYVNYEKFEDININQREEFVEVKKEEIISNKNISNEKIEKTENNYLVDEDYVTVDEEIDAEANSVINEIKDIFGENSIFTLNEDTCEFDTLNGKSINYIGIRNFNSFSNNMTNDEENAWFISRIKKLSKLKLFKMLKSENYEKDLVWNRKEKSPILISFRTTDSLDNVREFPFPL